MRKETVTSAQNPKIKNLLLLQEKSKARREQAAWKAVTKSAPCSCARRL